MFLLLFIGLRYHNSVFCMHVGKDQLHIRTTIASKTDFNSLIAMHACRNQIWQALAFVPLQRPSPLTKIGIIYAQLLQG